MDSIGGGKGPTLVDQPLGQPAEPTTNPEGQVSWGMTVSPEEGMVLLQKAVNESFPAGEAKALDQRTASVRSDSTSSSSEELTLEDAQRHLGDLEGLAGKQIEDGDIVKYFGAKDVTDRYQWVSDQAVKQAEKDVSKTIDGSRIGKVKRAANKLKSAFSHFIQKFRSTPKVADMMAEAVVELVDISVPKGATDDQVITETAHAANLLGNNPEELFSEMETKGMSDTVSALRSEFKVATKKNLGKMKSLILDPENARGIPATNGMSPKMTELMVNGALIIAKLADSNGTDASQIKGRGYLFGKIPESKYQIMEWLLNMEPDVAVNIMSKHPRLAGTNFAERMQSLEEEFTPVSDDGVFAPNDTLPFGGVKDRIANTPEDIFESGAVRMFEDAESLAQGNEDAFLARTSIGKDFVEAGQPGLFAAQLLLEGMNALKKVETKEPRALADAKEEYLLEKQLNSAKEKAEAMGGHPKSIAAQATQFKYRHQYASGLLGNERKLGEQLYKDVSKFVKEGMIEKNNLDGSSWRDQNTVSLTHAILVHCDYAVYEKSKSENNILMTLHGSKHEGIPEQDQAKEALRLLNMLQSDGLGAVCKELYSGDKGPVLVEAGFLLNE